MALKDAQKWFDPAPDESSTEPWISPQDVKNAFAQTYEDLGGPAGGVIFADALGDPRMVYGEWDPLTKYPPNSVVRSVGHYWIAQAAPLQGWRPDTDPSWLKLDLAEMAIQLHNRLMDTPRAVMGNPDMHRGLWDPMQFYNPGEIVSLGTGAATAYYIAHNPQLKRGDYPDDSPNWTLISLPDLAMRIDVAVKNVHDAIAAIPTGPTGPHIDIIGLPLGPDEGDLLRQGATGAEWISIKELWDGTETPLSKPLTDLQKKAVELERAIVDILDTLKRNSIS